MCESIATIGVYGTAKQSFFDALKAYGATHFIDIRRRRGVRGCLYTYANAGALEEALKQLGIEYVHEIDLSPPMDVIKAQQALDKASGIGQRDRTSLSSEFKQNYEEKCLSKFDLKTFASQFPAKSRLVLFCVEQSPQACHRSLVAEALAKQCGVEWHDITPL